MRNNNHLSFKYVEYIFFLTITTHLGAKSLHSARSHLFMLLATIQSTFLQSSAGKVGLLCNLRCDISFTSTQLAPAHMKGVLPRLVDILHAPYRWLTTG